MEPNELLRELGLKQNITTYDFQLMSAGDIVNLLHKAHGIGHEKGYVSGWEEAKRHRTMFKPELGSSDAQGNINR